jgi:hypothetical protein
MLIQAVIESKELLELQQFLLSEANEIHAGAFGLNELRVAAYELNRASFNIVDQGGIVCPLRLIKAEAVTVDGKYQFQKFSITLEICEQLQGKLTGSEWVNNGTKGKLNIPSSILSRLFEVIASS